MKASIIGLGSYLPKKVLTNADLEKLVETNNEWIVTRTGISERRIAVSDEYTSTMGIEAAKRALEEAKIDAKEIDLILVATLTPDYLFPSTACIIQAARGATNSAAFDIQAACSGYIYGLAVAKAFIESGIYKNVLLIASEKLSSFVDFKDRSTCILFGDGAAASVIKMSNKGLIIKEVELGADGKEASILIVPAGGSRNPATVETVKNRSHFIKMEGREVFKHAVRRMEMSIESCLKKAKMEESSIDWLIPHQANKRIIDALAKRFKKISEEKIFSSNVKKYGNTSASSVAIALDDLKGSIKKGENVLLTAFGSGLTWGSAILTRDEK